MVYIFCFFQLYDGNSENANLAGTFCGSTVPAPFLSTRNFLTVTFVTDSSVERAGFNATYTIVDRKYTYMCMHIYCCDSYGNSFLNNNSKLVLDISLCQ